jgi:hypothetical protein
MTMINNENELDDLLTKPSDRLLEDIDKIEGDTIILGAAGKMGPSMTVLMKRAMDASGHSGRLFAVSRFSNPKNRQYLEDHRITTFAGDLLDPNFLESLPSAENVIYLAGQKFGTTGNQPYTWAMNTLLPGLVCQRYLHSRIVAFSTGNVYPLMPATSVGANEDTPVAPIGEYAQSCLGRERIFEYFAMAHHTPVLIFRLNYALDLRYGVLNDIGQKIWRGEPVDLRMGHVNVIWQGDANEFAIRSLLHCNTPAQHLNVTGPQVLAVRDLAGKIGRHLDRKPIFTGEPEATALLSDASRSFEFFGRPSVSVDQMCEWTAHWIKQGGNILNKPTHFETRDGQF